MLCWCVSLEHFNWREAYSLPSWSFAVSTSRSSDICDLTRNMQKYDITWKNGLSFMTAKLRRCEHFVRYEGAMSTIGIVTVALMMFLRWAPNRSTSVITDSLWISSTSVRAMYRNNRYAVGFMAAFLFAWVAVSAWLLCHGEGERQSHSEFCSVRVNLLFSRPSFFLYPL